ncbi:hypothetical protein Nepgr_017844 [Nepenthes gracilis]|uniref:Mechanosensitive ion channel MscS domain-containing protein n=1 Tax=Nepenthes gracilis TaxID=150966 RepID=A0AAD3XSV8_NEPGR|nr:hypothetical protein Nepgr_017844 [Nepenthes gracilis]
MGDDGELQQTSIPISDNGSSQPPRPTVADLESENVRNASPSEHPDGDTQPSQADGECPNAGEIILLVLALVIYIPLYLIFALGLYLVCNKDASDMCISGDDSPQKKQSFHQRVREFQGTAVQVAKVAAVINSRVVILLMIWLVINLGVRSLRKKIILGSELWKWTSLIVIIFCGYSVISVVTRLALHYFTKACAKRKSAVYYAQGLRRSANFILLWISVILTWHFYFRSRKGLRKLAIEQISKDDLKAFKVDEDDRNLLYNELKKEDPHVRAHKNCLAMGYTLTDAKEVVHCLDLIMSAAVVVVIIIAWLLLTGVATTKLLVLIASPFLAITFIIGDTCRTLFEGIMFAFVKHPFDVGDLCIIDDCQLEVKQIGVLTTIFLAIDGSKEMWYPNSILITKAIG